MDEQDTDPITVENVGYKIFRLAADSGVLKPVPIQKCSCGFKGYEWEMTAHLVTKHKIPMSVVRHIMAIDEVHVNQPKKVNRK